MKKLIPIIILAGAIAIAFFAPHRIAKNPDPDHTHADFAVWIDGKQLDFSDEKYMSGSSKEESAGGHPHEHLHESLHLHDGNGHVIHRHKPGLTIGDFFDSLSMPLTDACLTVNARRSYCIENGKHWRMFVNEKEIPFGPNYVFQDGDAILLTWGSDDIVIAEQLKMLTHDACLYSKTCPERGAPPTESCIADPTVPCKQ